MSLNAFNKWKARLIYHESGCWLWPGSTNNKGYAEGRWNGEHWLIHRFFYIWYKGEVPFNHIVMHTCDNRRCANPDHLVTGTGQDNYNDALSKGRISRNRGKWTRQTPRE
jgi:hypothetical protein